MSPKYQIYFWKFFPHIIPRPLNGRKMYDSKNMILKYSI